MIPGMYIHITCRLRQTCSTTIINEILLGTYSALFSRLRSSSVRATPIYIVYSARPYTALVSTKLHKNKGGEGSFCSHPGFPQNCTQMWRTLFGVIHFFDPTTVQDGLPQINTKKGRGGHFAPTPCFPNKVGHIFARPHPGFPHTIVKGGCVHAIAGAHLLIVFCEALSSLEELYYSTYLWVAVPWPTAVGTCMHRELV